MKTMIRFLMMLVATMAVAEQKVEPPAAVILVHSISYDAQLSENEARFVVDLDIEAPPCLVRRYWMGDWPYVRRNSRHR